MKEYLILDITEPNDIFVLVQADSRAEAMAQLKAGAQEGRRYHEAKLLGAPIVPKTRSSIVLSREEGEDNAEDPTKAEE